MGIWHGECSDLLSGQWCLSRTGLPRGCCPSTYCFRPLSLVSSSYIWGLLSWQGVFSMFASQLCSPYRALDDTEMRGVLENAQLKWRVNEDGLCT